MNEHGGRYFTRKLIASASLAAAVMMSIVRLGSADAGASTVQVQMRNVDLHVDAQTILRVHSLRGELISTKAGRPPIFDDKNSFIVLVDRAEITMTADSLTRLLNNHVFRDAGSPLRDVEVATSGNQLRMKGTVHKGIRIPVTVVATPIVDPNGKLRLHATSIKAIGMPIKGLLSTLGLKLDGLVKPKDVRGVTVEGNDVVLDAAAIVPPPRIQGRLQTVKVGPGTVTQVFGPGRAASLQPTVANTNYMYYRGGVLRFGKLTMTDADMELIDQTPADPFDFFQDRYHDQLVAGYSKNTPDRGLLVYLPDYHRLAAARRSR